MKFNNMTIPIKERSHPNSTHGMTGSPEWLAHKNMMDRCYNENGIGYHNYGGRGIVVSGVWLGRGGFQRFYSDMGPRPSPTHSLDRIDNNGNYGPDNCRWATKKEQSSNQRTNRMLTLNGTTQTASQWAVDLGASIQAISARLGKYGWTVEKTLTTPFKSYRPGVTCDGRTQTLAAWTRETGLPRDTIRSRLRKGWPEDAAVKTPYGGKRPR